MSPGPFITGVVLGFAVLLPLGKKWEIDRRVTMPAAFLIGIASGAVVDAAGISWNGAPGYLILLQVSVILAISAALLLWRFYRDPERKPPDGEDIVVSPADGRVIYVKRSESGMVPFSEKNGRRFHLSDFVGPEWLPGEVTLIGIAMNFLDVHVNRAPIRGSVSALRRISGMYISMKKKEAVIRNERVLTVIENGRMRVGIVQIASRLVRNIVPYIGEGAEVEKGQRIGMIRFGSQVDLVLTGHPSLSIKARPGERVRAGLSVLASYDEAKQ